MDGNEKGWPEGGVELWHSFRSLSWPCGEFWNLMSNKLGWEGQAFNLSASSVSNHTHRLCSKTCCQVMLFSFSCPVSSKRVNTTEHSASHSRSSRVSQFFTPTEGSEGLAQWPLGGLRDWWAVHFCFILVTLGFDLGLLFLLGRCSYPLSHSSSLSELSWILYSLLVAN
jgi:hypothetical protein